MQQTLAEAAQCRLLVPFDLYAPSIGGQACFQQRWIETHGSQDD
jgi:hypothetical protein